MSDLLRGHLDGSARALGGTQATALAEVQVDLVLVAARLVELDHGVVRAHAEAVVAGEAVAAGEAAAGLEERVGLVEPGDHLVEAGGAAREVELRADRLRRVAVVPGVELVEGHELAP